MNNNKVQNESSPNRKRFWVLGAGKFGQIAAKRIHRFFPAAELTVVDKDPVLDSDGKVRIIRQEGVRWLLTMLEKECSVDIIVPAIPVHVAYDWMILKLMKSYHSEPMEIPESWLKQMPHASPGKVGQVFISHADFFCPDNCPEPKDRCTVTGKPRPMDLFRLLNHVDIDDALSIVLRSHQILPGVGGFYPEDLLAAYDTVVKNVHRPLFIATACRCHGVGNAVRLRKRSK